MKCFPNSCSPQKKNEILDKSLILRLQSKLVNNWLKWSFINFILLLIVLMDISYRCPQYGTSTKWLYFEYTLITIFTANLLIYAIKYMYYIFTFDPVKGTVEQRKLLQFDDADTSFVTASPLECPVNDSLSRNNATILSWHSSFNDSSRIIRSSPWTSSYGHITPLNQSDSRNISFGNCDTSMYMNSPLNVSSCAGVSHDTSSTSLQMKYLKEEIITDEKEFEKYLKKMYKSTSSETQGQHSTTFNPQTMNSFWNYCNTAASLLKTSLYQLSPSQLSVNSPMKQSGSSNVSGLDGGNDYEGAPEMLKKIHPAKLSRYVANLRMWISITILQRLEIEINRVDESFRSRGFSDLQIGNVGLERLKKTAENQQFVSMHVPMLPLIVPFLEMSTNQEYLVQRIKDLAKGSCIPDYRWNSGSSYHGLSWDEHLPTDSAILFHLFCTYLDSQLLPLPQPGGRPFFNQYVIIGDKKLPKDILAEATTKNMAQCAILCTNQLKPRFNFISDNKIHNCPYDRNNLFYVIIQFLVYMKCSHGGLLEGVNLGKSGINLLCIIE